MEKVEEGRAEGRAKAETAAVEMGEEAKAAMEMAEEATAAVEMAEEMVEK